MQPLLDFLLAGLNEVRVCGFQCLCCLVCTSPSPLKRWIVPDHGDGLDVSLTSKRMDQELENSGALGASWC